MAKEKKLRFLISRCLIIVAFFLGLSLPSLVHASDLGFYPSSGVPAQNSSFKVDVMLLNNGQSINAVSGVVTFQPDLLAVKSISTDGSIVKLWPNDPSYSNSDGTVHFEGVILNPGYSQNQGKILTITFTTKRVGKANVLFQSGSVLANDGNATNVLGHLGTASFVTSNGLDSQSVVAAAPNTTSPAENSLAPLAPKIYSSTHPDQNKWYALKNVDFSWNLPNGVNAVRILYNNQPTSVPTRIYQPAISRKSLADLADGSYYFHAQSRDDFGWGTISHYRFQIDTADPEPFSIVFPNGNESDNPRPQILLNATDSLSGIDHYDIKIGDADVINFTPSGQDQLFTLPPQEAGKHTILVRAYDKAGNSTVETSDFVISSINPPVITNYTNELEEGDVFKVSGTSYAGSRVTVYLQNSDGQSSSETTTADKSGKFDLTWSKNLNKGVYGLTAESVNDKGAKSPQTSSVSVVVKQKALWRVSSMVVDYLALGIMIIVAIASLIAFGWFAGSRLKAVKYHLRKKLTDAEDFLDKDLEMLKEDFKTEIELLEGAKSKRKLTREEAVILKNLNKRIDSIEEAMNRKFDDLKRDVR